MRPARPCQWWHPFPNNALRQIGPSPRLYEGGLEFGKPEIRRIGGYAGSSENHPAPVQVYRQVRIQAAENLNNFINLGRREFNGQHAAVVHVLPEIRAKLSATTMLMPFASSAQGACSRELPQPKFPRVRMAPLPVRSRFASKLGSLRSSRQ